ILDVLAILLLTEVLLFKMLLNPGFLAGTDALAHVGQVAYLSRDFRWLYAWRTFDLGFPENIRGLDFILVPLTLTVGDPVLAVKLFVFACFILAALTMYALVYQRTRSHNASLTAGIIYMLNQALLVQFNEAHVFIIFSYAFAPLVFLFLDKALKTGRTRDCIALAFCLTVLVTFFHPQMAYIYLFFLPLLFAVYVLVPEGGEGLLLRVKRLLKVLAIGGTIAFLLASFFFLPAILGSLSPYLIPGHPACTRSFEAFQGDPWLFLEKMNYAYLTMLLALASIATLFLAKRDRQVVFLILAGVVAAFMARGAQPPFTGVFTWMYLNLPGLATFREYMRWFLMSMLSFAFLLGFLTSKLEAAVRGESLREVLRKIRELRFFKRPGKPWPGRALLVAFVSVILFLSLVNAALTGFTLASSPQTYTYQERFAAPLRWMGTIPGEFRVAEVSSLGYGENWISPAIIGTGYRDLASDSYYLHDKPVLQTGGWIPLAEDFFKFTKASGERKIGCLAKLLAAFNVRYIILPPYCQQKWAEIFQKQEGVKPVLNYSGTLILENEHWAQRAFSSPKYGLVLGGRETITSMLMLPNFNLNGYTLIFIDQNLQSLEALTAHADSIIFSDGSASDLVFLLMDGKYVIPAGGANLLSYRFKSEAGVERGKLAFSNPVLKLIGIAERSYSFNAEENGEYEFWIRLAYDKQRGILYVKLDGETVKTLHPAAFNFKFEWVNLGTFQLEKGIHQITLTNCVGVNEVDALAIVPSQVMSLKVEEAFNLLGNFKGRIVLLKEAEDLFPGAYPIPFKASGGYAVKIAYPNNTAEVSIPRSGTYMVAMRIYSEAEKGLIKIGVAEESYTVAYRLPPSGKFGWVKVGPLNLEAGRQRLKVEPAGTIVDQVVIYSLKP
ncbi:MAG: hypothetical protein DRO52_06225, partial [Candidatus Hecatellales archaeon]